MGMHDHVTPVVVTPMTQPPATVSLRPFALFNADGTPMPATKQMPVQADSVAADVATMRADHNALLAKLKAAGLMASS